ncbi:MAG: tetratricopeptide repeat protein [Cyclobacteriaceae bacterium]|nr:MAG: tetratricopeptide repeat protein [Cyclobacteriaceae bacterium]
MTTKTLHSFLVILLLLPLLVVAQKKKKADDTTPASLKSREAEFYFTEGEKYFILEDFAKALVYYQKALDILPTHATIHYKVAEVLARGSKQDDLIRASLSIEQALKYERKNKYFYLLGASIYSNLSRFERAAQLYEAMLQEVPGTEDYLYELAILYQYSNKPAEAIRTYNRAEIFFGINETSSTQKQRIYWEQDKINEAIEEGEKLSRAYPDEEQYVVALAELLAQQNQLPRALRILEKFIDENTSAPQASVMLAGLYRDTNEEKKARELLVKIFNDPETDYNSKLMVLGTYNAELNNSKTKGSTDTNKETFALELLEKLEKQYPEEVNTFILGGDLYLSVGKNKEAEQKYLQAIALGEVNFEVWQNLLYLQTQMEDFDAVISTSEKALEYYPNQSMLYYFNGLAHLRKRKYKEAITSLEQSKRLSTNNPGMTSEINSMLGDAYNATKEYDKSDKAYDEALAFNPNNYIVLNNYSYYLALRKASLDKAEKMSTLLVKNNPDNAAFLDTHAWVLYTRQKFKEARKFIERAIATGQANATHFEHYGDILFQLGEVDQAVQQWEKAKGMLNASSETLNRKIANRKIYE